jgi:hypothetical protein
MPQIISPFRPWPKQWIASTVPEEASHRFYGGQVGGGKSDWMLNELHEIIMRIEARGESDRVIFIRRTFPELQEVIDRSEEICGLVATWAESKMRWVYPNGSTFEFGHVFVDKDVRKYKSRQFCAIAMDELTTFTEFTRDYLITRNRTPLDGVIPQFLAASNPGDIGHVHTKLYFVEPPLHEVERILYRFPIDEFMALWRDACTRFPMRSLATSGATLDYFYGQVAARGLTWQVVPASEEVHQPQPFEVWRPRTNERMRRRNIEREEAGLPPLKMAARVYIPSSLDDNPSLSFDGAYEAGLLQQTDEEIVATTTGDWSINIGQAFPEFSEKKLAFNEHDVLEEIDWHVIDPIAPPPHWQKWRAVDLGFGDPLAAGWFTIDPGSGQLIVYRELYEKELTDSAAKQRIHEMTPLSQGLITLTLGDPKSFATRSSRDGLTPQDVWKNDPYAVPVELSNNDRIAGKRQVHNLLAENPVTGRPGLVFTRNCVNLIRTLPQLILKKDSEGSMTEDVDDRGEDHAYDMLRYGLMGAPAGFFVRNQVKINTGKVRIHDVFPAQEPVRRDIGRYSNGRLTIVTGRRR